MRIALVSIPHLAGRVSALPLGIASIAAVLRDRGHDPVVFDGEVDKPSIDLLAARVAADDPSIVALTATSYSRFLAVEFAVRMKALGVRHVVGGGHHFSHMPTETLERVPAIDFVISGAAENALAQLATCLESGNVSDLGNIPSLTYRKGVEIVSTPCAADRSFADITRLPYELFSVESYSTWDDLLFLYEDTHRKGVPPGRTITYNVGRGCPWKCHFCANVPWTSGLNRPDEVVVDELRWLQQKYGTDHVIFIDPVFSLHRRLTRSLCQRLIDSNLDLTWFCSTRVNLVPDDLLDVMVESGLSVIQFGIESGSPRILDQIAKDISLDLVRDRVAAVVRRGVTAKVYFLFGHPGEQESDIALTIDFVKELWESFGSGIVPVGIFTDIYPGTELERYARESGALAADYSWFDPPDLSVNEELEMTETDVPIFQSVPVGRVLELVHSRFPALLNRDLRDGYSAWTMPDP